MRKNIFFFAATIICAVLFLNGCSTMAPKSSLRSENSYLSWNQRQQQLKSITQWNMTGVMGITYAGKTDIVNFNWNQKKDNYAIELYGPMHLGSAQIFGDKNSVTLLKSKTEKLTAASPEELIKQQFGWELPISYMRSWILALPAPYSKAVDLKLDEYNHLTELKQKNWKVQYSTFKSNYGIDLPTKIYMNSPMTKQLYIKLVVKTFWQS